MKERLLCLQELKFQLCQLKRWHVMKDLQWCTLDAVRDNVNCKQSEENRTYTIESHRIT